MNENRLEAEGELFTKKDFSHLPTAIQKYIEHCGYIDTLKISYLKMAYYDVDFKQGKNGPTMTIDYYQNRTGGMKGVVGKAITLFDDSVK